MPDEITIKEYIWGTGRRKSSVARVRIKEGSGKIIVNKKPLENYFPRLDHQKIVKMPLMDTKTEKFYDIWIKVQGGGITGQAGAARLGIARALIPMYFLKIPAKLLPIKADVPAPVKITSRCRFENTFVKNEKIDCCRFWAS